MDSNSGQIISIWMAIAEEPEPVPLGENKLAYKKVTAMPILGAVLAVVRQSKL